MFYFDQGLSRRRSILMIVGVIVLAWVIILLIRSKTNPFVSPWTSETEKLKSNAPPLVASLVVQKGGLSVIGPPTLTGNQIDQVLASYSSPAAGLGATMYQLGVKYGVDPAFCLAFFIQESSAGTQGVATVTKSVGNIRTTTGYRDYQGYRLYDSWEEGMDDWFKLIRDVYIDGWKLTTVEQILPVYAPPGDNNDTQNYIGTVVDLIEGWRTRQS